MSDTDIVFVDMKNYLWVDPPEGWKYGFPKLLNRNKNPDVREWMTRHGYPDDGASWRAHYRMWPASEDDVRDYDAIDNPE